MYGRYGTDNLYMFLTVLILVLIVANMIAGILIPRQYGLVKNIVNASFSFVTLSLLFYAMFRSMSRNIAKRRKENMAYLKAKRAVRRFFSLNISRGTKSRNRDDSFHIFRDCTKCGATVRLPRKPGKHAVKCPSCSHRFYVKSK